MGGGALWLVRSSGADRESKRSSGAHREREEARVVCGNFVTSRGGVGEMRNVNHIHHNMRKRCVLLKS